MLSPKSMPIILQLLLVPIVIGVGVEQVDECTPPVFREALSSMMTIHYDDLTCCNEDLDVEWSLLSILHSRRLGLAWKRVGGG